jgi:uncharacterized protein (TIRG00374 family)
VIAVLKRGYRFLVTVPAARVVLQAIISLVVLGLLVITAQRTNLVASLRTLQPGMVASAAALLATGYVLNSHRWQLLLRNVGVYEGLGRLAALYFIGQFFSLFLPTSAGGDAVRAYEVARRSQRTTQTIVATLQERLIGLGASLLIGLVATLYYLPLVPAQLRVWVMLIQIIGVTGVALLLYPAPIFAAAGRIWRAQGNRTALRQLVDRPLVARVIGALQPVAALPPLTPLRLARVLAVTITAILLGLGMYYVLGLSLQVQAGFAAFCLVIPLVWIVRMLPVSLNGVGVGEGAFVFLMGLFAVPGGKALALALAVLALQTGCALFGGLLLALRMARGTWVATRRPVVE